MSCRVWSRWLVAFAMAAVGCNSFADYIPPPEPLRVAFQPRRARLAAAGRIAVDRLAVRAARCDRGPLRVELRHSRSASASLVAARSRAVQVQVSRLGLTAVYVTQPVAGLGDAMEAAVTAGGSEYCTHEQSAILDRWAGELAGYVNHPSVGAPAFWMRMSARVRQQDLALPLAVTAYCGATEGTCSRNPGVLEWLTDRVARDAVVDVRRRWLQRFWALADDADLARLEAHLAVPGLDAAERGCMLAELGYSDLPWETMERRVMQPELIALLQEHSSCFVSNEIGPFIAAAVRHRRIEVLEPLLEAAKGGDRPKLLSFAIAAVASLADEDDFEAALARLTVMVSAVYRSGGAETVVDWGTATLHLLAGAHCPQAGWGSASPSRYAGAWDRLIQAGFVPDPGVLDTLTTTGFFEEPHRCLLERVPGEPLRYRPATRP